MNLDGGDKAGFDLPCVASLNATHFCLFAMQSKK